MDLFIIKLPSGNFAPYGEDSLTECAQVKVGQMLHGKFTRMRNYEFHKKFFALMQLGFDIWSETCTPLEYGGIPVLPQLNNFRKDCTILAGYYNAYYSLKGEVRLEAKSISFGSMDQEEFEKLYSSCIDVILRKCFEGTTLTEQQLRDRVEEILRFDK